MAIQIPEHYKRWDFFISYASEDREDLARPLAHLLDEQGYRVWFDEFTIDVGDSLNEKINEGLASSQCGIVIISRAFMQKKWPRNELNALVAMEHNLKRIIPVWHGITAGDLESFNPVLADRLALNTDQPLQNIVASIANTYGGVQTQAEPRTVEGLWNGISGRLKLSIIDNNQLIGEYDWFGQPWVGQLRGAYENRLFRFSWDWSLDDTNGQGFLFRVGYRCDLRRGPDFTLCRLIGGWVYDRDATEIDPAIELFRACFEPKRYLVDEEIADLPKIPALRIWDFTYDLRLYSHRYRRRTNV